MSFRQIKTEKDLKVKQLAFFTTLNSEIPTEMLVTFNSTLKDESKIPELKEPVLFSIWKKYEDLSKQLRAKTTESEDNDRENDHFASENQENVAVEDFDLINVNLELTTNSCVQDDDLGLIYEVFEDTASSPFRDKTNLESTASTSQGHLEVARSRGQNMVLQEPSTRNNTASTTSVCYIYKVRSVLFSQDGEVQKNCLKLAYVTFKFYLVLDKICRIYIKHNILVG